MQIVDVCRIGHQYCFGGTPHSRSRGSGSDSTRYPFDSRETPQPPGFLEDIFPSILHPPPPSSITSWKSRYSGRSFASAFSAYPFRRSRTVSFAVLDPRAGSGTFSFFPTRLSISVPDPPLSTNASARVVSAVFFFWYSLPVLSAVVALLHVDVCTPVAVGQRGGGECTHSYPRRSRGPWT